LKSVAIGRRPTNGSFESKPAESNSALAALLSRHAFDNSTAIMLRRRYISGYAARGSSMTSSSSRLLQRVRPLRNALRRHDLYRFPSLIAAALLAAMILSLQGGACAAQAQSAAVKDKTEALLKRGYVELSGEDAVRFLVGNSIFVRKTDTPKGFETPFNDEAYYFSDAHTAYDCRERECATDNWKVQGSEICFELPSRCDDADYKYYAAPRVFKAPHVDERTGRIGVYVEHGRFVHAVIRGNAANALLLDWNVTADKITLDPKDFAREIKEATAFSGGDKKVPLRGPRAVSFLIGNTFMSGETARDEHGDTHLCPVQGYYYFPDGRLVTFNCLDWPNFEMGITHWKRESNKFCLEDVEAKGSFGCRREFETVYLTPSDASDAWFVMTEDFPRKIFGYAGNVFRFR
jgi:hypothetical protein